MRTWAIAKLSVYCGCCEREVPAGAPYLMLVLPGVQAKKFRCPGCAGEPVPADVGTSAQVNERPLDLTRLGLLPLAFGKAAAREREVGEEG